MSYGKIHKICTDFVNSAETTIGMECQWLDTLICRVDIQESFTREEVTEALKSDVKNSVLSFDVIHGKYGEMAVFVKITDSSIVMSTKDWLLLDAA